MDSAAIIDGQVNTQDLAVGAVGAAQLQNDAVTGANVLDGSLTGADIQDNSIGSADIAPGAIGTGHLSDGSVNGAKVFDGSLTGADIQDGSIGTADIAPGAIGTGQLSDGAVTGTKVQAGSLTGAHMQDGSLTGLQILDGSIVSADIAPGAVGTGQLSDGAVTGAKIGAGSLTGANIQDGSIDTTKVGFNYAGSDSKGGPALDLTCIGCVSRSELDFAMPGSAARQVVVAASGGDFTSIQAAINSISPSATNPYIIKVMPGTYIENVQINMKSYIALEGSGRDVTIIQSPNASSFTVWVLRASNVSISGFTIKGGYIGLHNYQTTAPILVKDNAFEDNDLDIHNYQATAVIRGNDIRHNFPSRYSRGIMVEMLSDVVIQGNVIANKVGSYGYGIYTNTSSAVISGNIISGFTIGIENYNASTTVIANSITNNSEVGVINAQRSSATLSGNKISGNAVGVSNSASNPTVIGNVITGNRTYGISTANASKPVIANNTVTGNGGGTYQDIFVASDSTPNISFNIYDTISGTTGIGLYNVTSSGDPTPAP